MMPVEGPDVLYRVLCVERDATLEEIKLAFKRRALQVHPDKGGSKDAFHLVYQAFETLADSEARRRYDQRLDHEKRRRTSRPGAGARGCGPASASRPGRAAAKRHAAERAAPGTKSKGAKKEVEISNKLLSKLYELLKLIPRGVRNDVLAKDFSQKQRVLLEKWIVLQREGTEGGSVPAAEGGKEASMVKAPPPPKHAEPTAAARAAARSRLEPPSRRRWGKLVKLPLVDKGYKVRRKEEKVNLRGLVRQGSGYRARLFLFGIRAETQVVDLSTAVEFLVILTSIKQRVQASGAEVQDSSMALQHRLQEAVEVCAMEHGRRYEELRLRWHLVQHAGIFFVGRACGRRCVFSPVASSVEEVMKYHRCMAPFRAYMKQNLETRKSLIWHYGPLDLTGLWELFLNSVAAMWEDRLDRKNDQLRKMQALYDANVDVRAQLLQQWELKQMSMHDKNRHRPRRFRTSSLRWERKQMKMHDKDEHPHGCKRLRQRCHWEREQMSLHDKEEHQRGWLQRIRKLLHRWRHLLRIQERLAEKKRQSYLRQRKKERLERRRQDEVKRKHARDQQKAEQQAQRLRRDTLRKRRMSDLTMDEILGKKRGDAVQTACRLRSNACA
ncbi:Chaperone protein DnaJ [Durusdinium trenchii]|uniref:Chaperone protein DnaJ n=1 Tax=Durusdinium trenchii TaxID=1381693 RepID=A0ABP0L1F9_9DINO